MRRGSIVKAIGLWSIDRVVEKTSTWQRRDIGPNENFIVLTKPFWVFSSTMGIILQGKNGIEIVTCYVVNTKAFHQKMEYLFEEVK